MFPVAMNAAPLLGSSSAEARSWDPSDPPAINTPPFKRVVAECDARGVERSGPLETDPDAGSKISVELRTSLLSYLPAISTRLSGNDAAALLLRAVVSILAGENLPAPAANIARVDR